MISKLILHEQSHVPTEQPTNRRRRLERHFSRRFSVSSLVVPPPIVNNNPGHLTKSHVGFSVGSIRATVSGAKRWHNESLLDCSCCRKIHLHFTPQLRREVMAGANKPLQMYVYIEMLEEKKSKICLVFSDDPCSVFSHL